MGSFETKSDLVSKVEVLLLVVVQQLLIVERPKLHMFL